MILNAIFMPTMCIIDKFNGLLLFEFKTEKAFYCFDNFFFFFTIIQLCYQAWLPSFFLGGHTMSYLKKKNLNIMCKRRWIYVIYRVNVLSIIHHVQLILLDPTKILLRVGLCQNLWIEVKKLMSWTLKQAKGFYAVIFRCKWCD